MNYNSVLVITIIKKGIMLKALREGLGRIIVFINFITKPKKIVRTDAAQKLVDKEAEGFSLYQFYACPFCIRTRRAIHRLNINIEFRDAQNDAKYRQELLAEGGEIKVPCLRIEEKGQVVWMYESVDIIAYLNKRFGE
jgi:glutaredoxin